MSGITFQLHDATGQRKYLTRDERDAFLEAAGKAGRQARTFCMTLAYTGSRVSEALALTADRVDLAGGTIVFESLKKRRGGLYRAVPVPSAVLDALDLVHGLREAQRGRDEGRNVLLWPWGRATAWRRVTEVMSMAGISGPQASPKGLRHGFGVAAVQAGIPLNMVQKWLGHAQLSTTAIYADAVGAEAVRRWIAAVGARTAFIEPGSPWENGYIESFNARLRDELLNGEIFYTLKEARVLIESWRRHYNAVRPHSSLGYRPPAPETIIPPSWPPGSATLRRPSSLAEKPAMH